MSTTNTIRAEIEHRFVPIGMSDIERAYPTLDITYRHTPGYPASGPSWGCAGDPGEADELEFIAAALVDSDRLDPTPAQLVEMAADWLNDAGYERACDEAR